MQNITVKVCYKGKTLIVGKGINSIEEITKQLVKRFPQVDQLKSSLTVEYENGADDLSTAYGLAQKESRRFIKVKFVSGEQNDTSFVSERLDDTCVLSILDVNQGKDKVTDFIKSDQTKIQSVPENEPKSEAFQNLDDRAQVKIQNTLIDASLKKQASSSEQTLLAADQKKEATGKKSDSQIEVHQNLLEEASEAKPQQEQTEVLLDYGLLDDYAPQKQQKKIKAPTKDEKREMFAKLFGTDNSEQAKKQESLNSESMAVLEIVRKEFDTKISTLQAQYDDLSIKYNDLSSKYDNLSIAFGVKNEVKFQSKSQKVKDWFEQNWQEPKSSKDSKLPVEQYYVQIQEFQTIETAIVGENVQSTFRFKNTGMKKWPENVFAQDKNSEDLIDIKSLEPKQSVIVTLHTIKAQKVGDKINKTYQLVYFDKNNNLRNFGRVFGISINVVQPKSFDSFFDEKKPEPIKPIKPSNMKKTDPAIEFRAFIDEIMKKNKLVKHLYDVIASLKEYDVTEQNYKNLQIKTLTEFIRSICN